MKYQLLGSENPETLSKRVNEALENGWTPQGGISQVTAANQDGLIVTAYAQAIIYPDD